MPKKWDLYRNEIENLYMNQGHTLLDVQKAIKRKHGFEASTRAYRMRLDQWKMWKNKSKPRVRRNSDQNRTGRNSIVLNEESNKSRSLTLESALSPKSSQETRAELVSSSLIDLMRPPDHTPNVVDEVVSPELTIHFPLPPPVQHNTQSHPVWPLTTMFSIGPLVNSSLMFFSDRPVDESLRLLASSPLMAPLALEILLRNWIPGRQCMEYALMFVQDRACCGSILDVNWTRWWHTDETLFDLIDENVPKAERNILVVALLKADLQFIDPVFPFQVPKLCAPWAVDWRLAAGQKKWLEARNYVLKFDARKRLRRCALVVIAEHMLGRHKHQMELWRSNGNSIPGTSESFPNNDMTQYFQILHDCTERKLEIDSSWYIYAGRSRYDTAKSQTSHQPSSID